MVSSVNRSSGVNNSGGSIPLIPPSELYKQSPVKSSAYRQDGSVSRQNSAAISELGQFGVGALSGYKYHETVMSSSTTIGDTILHGSFNQVVGSFKEQGQILGTSAANAAGVGALLSGGLSAVSNTLSFVSGHESFRSAGADVVTDTIKGAVSGVGGLAVGGMSSLALSAFKVTGTPLVIAGIVGGAIGASLLNKYLNTEGLRSSLKGNH